MTSRPEPISYLQCINAECGRRYPLFEIRYRCETCGELLEVRHDMDRLRLNGGDTWRDIFDSRLGSQKFPWGSGVWRFKELILPDLPADKIVSLYEGDTNLAKSRKLCKRYDVENLYFKLEGENPTLSFKDRGMTAGVSFANAVPGTRAVACASTGDTSAAMAAYAASAEALQGIVFLPENKISFEQLSQPISSGAVTLSLRTDFDGCMKLVVEYCDAHQVYLLNSMNSVRIEGQKAIGFEIIQQLSWQVPDWIVIPVGNAGNISALGKGLKEMYELGIIDRLPRIAGAQVDHANPVFESFRAGYTPLSPQTARPTVASAIQIGNPVSFKKAVAILEDLDGVVESASEQEVMDACAVVAAAGISICPNSATAVAAFAKLRDRDVIREDDTVVIVSTAHGLKFSNTVIRYHQDDLPGIDPAYRNSPRSVEPDLASIEEALAGVL